MLSSLKLRNRILLGYVLPITFLVGLGWLIYRGALERESAATKIKIFQNTIVNTQGMTNGLSKMLHNVRGRVLFPLDISYEKNYEQGYQLFRDTSALLEQEIQDSDQRQKLTIILTESQRIDEISRRIFDLVKKGEVDYARTLTASLRFADIEQAQEGLLRKEQEFLIAASQEEQSETRWLLTLIVIGTGLSALSALSVGLWTVSDISKMMNRVATAIATSSIEIVATVQQQERTASQQAAAVNQTTITMGELGATSQVTAEQVETVAAEANQALQLAEGGTQTANRTLAGMTLLNGKVEAIAEQIGRLNEQAQQVGHISSLVSELANQTNMLALNAAVEAVRAGAEGKGFAVIATEIRQLADRSKASAQKINHLVTDIQTAIRSTVAVVDEGKEMVASGMQLTKGTTDAFSGVAEAIDNIAASSQQISRVVQKQAVAVQQVGYTMKVLSQGAEETAHGLSQTKASTEQLNEAAQNLKSVL